MIQLKTSVRTSENMLVLYIYLPGIITFVCAGVYWFWDQKVRDKTNKNNRNKGTQETVQPRETQKEEKNSGVDEHKSTGTEV